MVDPELALLLKKAGFPQEGLIGYWRHPAMGAGWYTARGHFDLVKDNAGLEMALAAEELSALSWFEDQDAHPSWWYRWERHRGNEMVFWHALRVEPFPVFPQRSPRFATAGELLAWLCEDLATVQESEKHGG